MKKNSLLRTMFKTLCRNKFLITMKFCILLILLNIISSHASVFSQADQIKINKRNTTLRELFAEIERQTGYDFFYNTADINLNKEIRLSRYHDEVEKILQDIFKKNGPIRYRIFDNHIVLYKEKSGTPEKKGDARVNFSDPLNYREQIRESYIKQQSVTGTVISAATGESLPGVNVYLKGTNKGTITDINGNYSLELSGDNPVLIFSYVGFNTEEVAVNNRSSIDLQLIETIEKLDEVIVVGYGTMKKSDLTGSVASVKVEDINKVPIRSMDQALKGQVAGVQVTEASGAPGSRSFIRIRGANSITASNEPLFIVDGFQVGSIMSVNPNNIESIEILKDASATAIYGSRGANGVVLITTRRGREGKTTINVSSYYGIQEIRKKLEMLNAGEYAMMANEAIMNSNIYLPPSRQADSLYTSEEIASFGEGTDWQNAIFRTAPVQNHTVSFTGGDERTLYSVSLNYYNQQGILIGSGFDRLSARINLDRKMNEKIKLSNNIFISKTKQDYVNSSNVRSALIFSPTLPVRDTLGNYVLINNVPNGNLVINPVSEANEILDERNRYYTLANMAMEYNILPELKLNISLGGEAIFDKNNEYQPKTTYFGNQYNGIASVYSRLATQWQNEITLGYVKTINEIHSLNLLAGFTIQEWYNEYASVHARNFKNDYLLYHSIQSAEDFPPPGSGSAKNTLISGLTRLNYILKDKYLFTFTARRDGSSRFGEGNKWGFFPSGAIGWKLSEEGFIEALNVFSQLKLRLSYGLTGNQEIGNYRSIATFAPGSNAVIGGVRSIGYSQTGLPNPNLRWESTKQFNFGIDMGLWANRVNITTDIYNKITEDLLLEVQLPYTSGFNKALKNIGSTQNQGVELLITSHNLVGNFKWSTSFNIAMNKNKIIKLVSNEPEFIGGLNEAILQEGEELGSFYGYEVIGIFQDSTELNSYPYWEGSRPGDFKILDLNDDGSIDFHDRKVIGHGMPRYFGGITNDFEYKGIELSIFFQGIYGADVFNRTKYELQSLSNGRNNNSREVLNRWTGPGTSNTVPAAKAEGREERPTSYYIEDGSYLQLRNITLSYDFERLTKKWGWPGTLRVYLTGQNLWTLTKYSGYDPEVHSESSTYRKGGNDGEIDQKIINVDYVPYPKFKSMIAGIEISF